MYEKANVTGPAEFGALAPGDRVFWINWLDEKLRRQQESRES